MTARIYIVGCAHSGTTLLRRLFHAFSGVRVVPYEIDLDAFAAMEVPPGEVLVGKRTISTIFSNQLDPAEGRRQRELLISRPDIELLCVYRDGRDVVLADNAPPARWLSSIHQMVLWDDMLLSVKYEDLVTWPDRIQGHLAAHYGLEIRHPWSAYPAFFPGDDHKSIYPPRAIGPHRVGKDPVAWRRKDPWLAPRMEQALRHLGYLEEAA